MQAGSPEAEPSAACGSSSSSSVRSIGFCFTLSRCVAAAVEDNPVLYRSEVLYGQTHPQWAPVDQEVTHEVVPNLQRVIFTLYAVANACDQPEVEGLSQSPSELEKVLLFEFIVDFTKLEFVAKNFSALADVGTSGIPSHIDDTGCGSSFPFTVLVKCVDGVFFPAVEDSGQATFVRRSPRVPHTNDTLQLSKSMAYGAGGSSFLQAATLPSDWDLMDDVEAFRLQWERAQGGKRETATIADIKALAVASVTWRRVADAWGMALEAHRNRIDEAVSVMGDSKALPAVQSAITRYTVDIVNGTLIPQKQAELESLQREIALKKAAIAEQRAVLNEKASALRHSPTEVALESAESYEALSRQLRQDVDQARSSMIAEIATCFPIRVDDGTICGLPWPPLDVPERLEHDLAIGCLCHLIVLVGRMHRAMVPHPISLSPARCRVFDRIGVVADDRSFPLHSVAKQADRALVRRGMDLLRQDIVALAYKLHRQRQAEGLPMLVAAEKLIHGR